MLFHVGWVKIRFEHILGKLGKCRWTWFLFFLVDTTRVLLGKDGGYINANFIKMSVKDENYVYIACQGPLPTTLSDFWQMVLEQKSNVIAMMTREVEGGKVKCQRYWPDTPMTAEMVDDRLQITLIKDQFLENFGIRLIEVKDIQVGSYTNLMLLILWSLMFNDNGNHNLYVLRPMKHNLLLIWTTRVGQTTEHPHNQSTCWHLSPTWGTSIDRGLLSPTAALESAARGPSSV